MTGQTVLLLAPTDSQNLPLTLAVRREGYRVVSAASTEEAFTVLERDRIALVIVDMAVAGPLSAIDVLSTVRARWPDVVRVLMCPADDAADMVAAVNQAHIYAYLIQPVDVNQLRTLVRDSVRFHELLCDNRRLYESTVNQSLQTRQLNDDLERKVAERMVEIERKNSELEENFLDVIRLLTNLLEVRSSTMAGQSHYMADAARWLSRALFLPLEEQRNIEIAALLHNLGQLGLPDSVIQKSTLQLENRDKEMLRHSALVAESLLSTVPRLRRVATIVRHQGEWWNGQGFPDGLSGEAIPIGSRVLAVVAGYLKYQDFATLQQSDGKRYDPAILREFRRYLDERPKIRQQQARSELKLHPSELDEGMILARDLVTCTGQLVAPSGQMVDRGILDRLNALITSTGGNEAKVYVQV
ncbi:MAG TPA: HD domain-containing phosphohydrolase [Anaerolineales bacterium]|nr:HD domain-containing phosphohydrolase [Anaerolineales bacterium]